MTNDNDTRGMFYCKRRQSIVLADHKAQREKTIKPHCALILAYKNGVKLTDVIDGKRVMVSV